MTHRPIEDASLRQKLLPIADDLSNTGRGGFVCQHFEMEVEGHLRTWMSRIAHVFDQVICSTELLYGQQPAKKINLL